MRACRLTAVAARVLQLLNLALTKKSKQANELEEMCGFPLPSLDAYVEKLVRALLAVDLGGRVRVSWQLIQCVYVYV